MTSLLPSRKNDKELRPAPVNIYRRLKAVIYNDISVPERIKAIQLEKLLRREGYSNVDVEALESLRVAGEVQDGNTTMYDVTFNETGSASAEARQKSAKERMDAFQQRKIEARFAAHAKKKAEKEATEDPNENVQRFWDRFNEKAKNAMTFLEEVLAKKTKTSTKAEISTYMSEIDAVFPQFDEIQEMLSNSSYYLPGFDRRIGNKKIKEMRERAAAVKEQLQPRKKFSFKSKRAASKVAKEATKTDAPVDPIVGKEEVVESAYPEVDTAAFDLSIDNRSDEVIVVEPDQLQKGGDVVLYNLTNCVVILRSVMSALRVDKLTNCRVYGGPIAGSLLLHYCTNTKFWLASRQIRLHHSTECVFHLHALSHPIIEDCHRLFFAPYNLDYQGLAEQLSESSLLRKSGMWKLVNDFKWHKIQHSPNWAILERSEWETAAKSDLVTLLENPRPDISEEPEIKEEEF